MMSAVKEALEDADIFLLVIDASGRDEPDERTLRKIRDNKTPVIVVLNKTDITRPEKLGILAEKWNKNIPGAEIVPVSAMKHKNIDVLWKLILKYLPPHPAYYDKDETTDRTERFFVSEIIREKLLKNYDQEIPYACEVKVEEFKENVNIISIRAVIYVERESQKAIILGHKGAAIKKMGTEARLSIEHFLGKKVFIDLFLKVDKDWRNNPGKLKKFGY